MKKLKKPKMILFDFGETLITDIYTPIRGNQALLKRASKNPNNTSAEEIQNLAEQISRELNRNNKVTPVEIHTFHFQKYIYEYFGVEFDITPCEMEKVFLSESVDSKATKNIEILLNFLNEAKVRTGVISNMSFSGEALKDWVQKVLPFNRFELIMASSEYVFKKPSKYLFEIALKKANLNADEVWYCGNNFLYDVLGSYNAGLQPVWYKGAKWEDNGGDDANCKFIEVADWNELIDLISNME